MKILIIHLSDLHIKDKSIYSQCDSIATCLDFDEDVEKCLIVISGDLSNSGEKYQYNMVKEFIGILDTKIKSVYKKIDKSRVLVVPGNHDIDFNGKERDREECRQMINNLTSKTLDSEIEKFNNFYNFASYNRCFISNKVIDVNKIDFGDVVIGYKLINSALFSHYDKDQNADEDKGLHFIDTNSITESKLNDTTFNICISHYPYDWLNYQSQQLFSIKVMNGVSVLFTGHEHNMSVYCKNDYDSRKIICSQAGRIDCISGDFSAMQFDSEDNSLLIKEFIYQKMSDKFVQYGKNVYEKISNDILGVRVSDSFLKDFYMDKLHITKSLLDYYVFPRLKVKIPVIKGGKSYLSFNDLYDDLEKCSTIFVNGEQFSGKTAFSKKLFSSYHLKGYIPVYINISDYKNLNINKEIMRIINTQYECSGMEASSIFYSINQSKKILIIDDCDKLKSDDLNWIIENYTSEFGKIFFIGEVDKNINIKKILEEQINMTSDYLSLDINPFYKDKREELIDKVVKYINSSQIYSLDDYMIKRVKQILSSELATMIYYPQYIITFLREFLSSSMIDKQNKSLFNELFENDIKYQLLISSKNKNIDPNAVYFCLRVLAYEMNLLHKCPITIDDIMIIVKMYNNDYAYEIDSNDLINVLLDSKIIKKIDSNSYRFTSKKQYAYLIAKELNIRANEKDEISINFFKNILKNVHKYINDEIILYLIFITESKAMINNIIECAEEILCDKEEYDIERVKFKFNYNSYSLIVNKPDNDDNKNYVSSSVDSEQKYLETRNMEIDDYYDDKEEIDEELASIQKAMTYFQLLSRCICNFYSFIKVPEKSRIVKQLYELPNKIIFEIFNKLNDDYDELVTYIQESYKKEKNKELDISKVNTIFSNMLILFLTSEYLTCAKFAVDRSTIKFLLNNCEHHNVINYKLQQLVIHSYYKDSDKFNDFALSIIKEYEKKKEYYLIEQYLKLIVKHFWASRNDLKMIGKMQSVVDKLFDRNEKVELISFKK